jgi:hypothetical protein
MHVVCPHCREKTKVPEVYADRLVKCVRCHGMYVPRHAGEVSAVLPQPAARPRESAPATDSSVTALPEFEGMRTEHEVLLRLCQQAKVTGNTARFNFLAAYANAQTALQRDTWQAASFEWVNAHKLLDRVQKSRAQTLVQEAHREFVNLASDQLVDFVKQMQGEFKRETAQMPPRARKLRLQKVAVAFRNLVGDSYRPLVHAQAVRQVEHVADEWANRALALE